MATPYPQTEQQDGEGEEEGRQGPEQEVAPTRLQEVDEQHEQCRHQIDCQGDQQQGRGVDHLDASLVKSMVACPLNLSLACLECVSATPTPQVHCLDKTPKR